VFWLLKNQEKAGKWGGKNWQTFSEQLELGSQDTALWKLPNGL